MAEKLRKKHSDLKEQHSKVFTIFRDFRYIVNTRKT